MAAPPTLYGIAHCDTVKKARAWLAARGVEHRFHDVGKAGVPPAALARWIDAVGWQRLINRQGTTWRRLDAAQQQAVLDGASAAALLMAHPSAIRRPVVDWGDAVTAGFDAAGWQQRLPG